MSSNLDRYLAHASRTPLLTPVQEIMLATQVQEAVALQARQDAGEALTKHELKLIRIGQRARNKMVSANLRLVVSVAKKYIRLYRHLTLDDVIQNGNIGLIRAVERFDPTRGYKFSTYAYWWIRQGISREAENTERMVRVPIHAQKNLTTIHRATQAFLHKHGTSPSINQLVDLTGLNPVIIREAMELTVPVMTLDGMTCEDGCTLLDRTAPVVDEESVEMERLEHEVEKDTMHRLLMMISDKQRLALCLRYGIHSGEGLSLVATAKRLGDSYEYTRQLLMLAKRRLRVLAQVTA